MLVTTMDWFVKGFIKAGLAWLGLGVLVGLGMAALPDWVALRPAHAHMVVLGFVVMLLYGVAYHVIPRFTGHQLYSRRLAGWHFWLSNAGLLVMVAAFALLPLTGRSWAGLLTLGGVLSAAGAFTFIFNLWRTIDGQPVARGGDRSRSTGPQRLNVTQPGR
jgi:cbb3-type cytochrome oxidase subunit 1